MSKAQTMLLLTLAACCYNVGTIWMVQVGYRLWPYVAPEDFGAYHRAWWAKIRPVVFPVAALALFGSIAMIWWRPEGVTATPLWLNIVLQFTGYALTAALWGRWQAQLQHAKLPDGSLDPIYVRIMRTHWIRVLLIMSNGILALWMLIEHLSTRVQLPAAP